MKILFKILLFCFFTLPVEAQSVYAFTYDTSIIAKQEKEVKETRNDSIKAYGSLKLSLICNLVKDTTKAYYYLNQGLTLSRKYPFLEAAAYYYKANALYEKGKIFQVEENLLKGDSLLNKFQHQEAFRIRGNIWLYYAAILIQKGDIKKTMAALVNMALPFAQKSNDDFLLGKIDKAIAIVLSGADQRIKAADYFTEAIEYLLQSSKDNYSLLENLVQAYLASAENYIYLAKTDSAKKQLEEAKRILNDYPKSDMYLGYYYTEGIYYDKIGQYKQAITSFENGKKLAPGPLSEVFLNKLTFAKYKARPDTNNYAASINTILSLLNCSEVLLTDKALYLKELYENYSKAGNSQKAYYWAKEYINFTDSVNDKKSKYDITELENIFNKDECQKQNSLLQAEKEKAILSSRNNRMLVLLLGSTSLFLLIVSTMGLLYYRNSKRLAAQKMLSYQQQLKETEQNQQLHLAKALLEGEERERKRIAGDLHDGLGGMLAGVKINLSRITQANSAAIFSNDLPKVITQLDNSVNELRRIARNMMPETLVSSGLETALKDICESYLSEKLKLSFQALNIQKNIPLEKQVTIYRIVQELITNAIRHADSQNILVQCSQQDKVFHITVEDDGKGFIKAEIDGKGIGLTNVKNRVDYLNGQIEISSALNEGTTINIELNVG